MTSAASPWVTSSTGLNVLGTEAAAAGAGTGGGLIGGMMSSPYAAPAAIMSGTQLIGGVMQGYGAQKQQEKQEQLAEDDRKRYNTNIGTRLWG